MTRDQALSGVPASPWLHALAGHSPHEIRAQVPADCSRCHKAPAVAIEGLCEACKDFRDDLREDARRELEGER